MNADFAALLIAVKHLLERLYNDDASGLTSRETIRLADELRMMISKLESAGERE
jgi:hypothetical protein